MDKKVIDELAKPVAVAFKPGPGGMKYKYVKGDDVINRLNKAFEYDWSSQVVNIIKDETQIIAHVKLTAGGVSKEGFGGAEIAVYSSGQKQGKPVDISNAYKSAVTNGIKKAAEQFGIGLTPEEDVSGGDDNNGGGNNNGNRGYTPSQNQYSKPAPVVSNNVGIRTTPVVNAPVVTPAASTPVVVAPPAVVSVPVVTAPVVTAPAATAYKPAPVPPPVVPAGSSFNGVNLEELSRIVNQKMKDAKAKAEVNAAAAFAAPVAVPVVNNVPVVAQPAPVVAPPVTNVPSFTPPANTFITPSMDGDMENSMFPQSGNDEDPCTDVQVQALNGLVRMKKISETEAITKCIPGSVKSEFKNLCMGEARTIIKVLQIDTNEVV